MFRSSFFLFMLLYGPTSPLAHPFSIDGVDLVHQQQVQITAQNKSGIVVLFLAANCPSSKSHMKEILSLKSDFSDFQFVGVHSNQDVTAKSAQLYFASQNFPFVILNDQDGRWLNHFKALKTPHAYVVAPNGQTLYRGGVSDSHTLEKARRLDLREALTDIRSQKRVRVPEGRALGCAISRERT